MNDINDLKRLRDSIEKMERIHQIHIFKILKENQIEFTENSNGVFINMNLLDDNVIIELMEFLEFINKNNEMLLQREKDYENTKQ